jgi:phosphatidylglycerol:prolipoprotein diacylglycerol transferase
MPLGMPSAFTVCNMYPSFDFLGVHLESFAVAQSVGVIAAYAMLLYFVRSEGLDQGKTFTAWCVMMVISAVTSYIAGVVLYQWGLTSPRSGEASIIGPLIAIPLYFAWTASRLNEAVIPALTVSFATSQFFGKIGCLLAGCCYGQPTSTWAGIRPIKYFDSSFKGWFLVPVQVYDALIILVLLVSLVVLYRRFSNSVTLAAYCLSYFGIIAVARFCMEFYRGDTIIGIGGLSRTQLAIPVCLATVNVSIWLMRRKAYEPTLAT